MYSAAGSLGTSVFDTQAYLLGASGGVYSLLAAHLANIMLVGTYGTPSSYKFALLLHVF